MNELALVSIAVGALIIAVRGPLLFAPDGTVVAYRWLLASQARIRVAGVVLGALGLAMILSAHGSGQGAAWVISIVGWWWALGAGFLLLIFTSFWQQIAQGIVDAVDDSALLRWVGVIGALFGAFMVYLGVGVF